MHDDYRLRTKMLTRTDTLQATMMYYVPSLTARQNLFSQCELEFKYLDMVTNPQNTCI